MWVWANITKTNLTEEIYSKLEPLCRENICEQIYYEVDENNLNLE
ncbi:hypothetical protein [Mesomycoplasma hyopneumoniae]|nr:hypothetical protein [Mesomycoplasma hyopneumoniae]